MKYSEILREKIRSGYHSYECGYKQLARKYGLKREPVRAIILNTNKTGINTVMPETEKLEFKSKEDKLEYYKTAAMCFEAMQNGLK